MKTILAVLVSLFFIVSPAAAMRLEYENYSKNVEVIAPTTFFTTVDATKCLSGSEADILEFAKNNRTQVYQLNADKHQGFVDQVNANRASNKAGPVVIDKFWVVVAPNGAVHLFQLNKGCILENGVVQVSPQTFMDIMERFHLLSKDFTAVE